MATFKLTQVSKGDEFLPPVRDHRPKLYLFKTNIGVAKTRPANGDVFEVCNLLPGHEVGRVFVQNSKALTGEFDLRVIKGDPGSTIVAQTNPRATDATLVTDAESNGRSNGSYFAPFRSDADRQKTLAIAMVCTSNTTADVADDTETIVGVEIYEREEMQ